MPMPSSKRIQCAIIVQEAYICVRASHTTRGAIILIGGLMASNINYASHRFDSASLRACVCALVRSARTALIISAALRGKLGGPRHAVYAREIADINGAPAAGLRFALALSRS